MIDMFNLAFRCGANARAADGHPLDGNREAPDVPAPPEGIAAALWVQCFSLGYQIGASDLELASTPEPGAVGMIRELGPDMLSIMGVELPGEGGEREDDGE